MSIVYFSPASIATAQLELFNSKLSVPSKRARHAPAGVPMTCRLHQGVQWRQGYGTRGVLRGHKHKQPARVQAQAIADPRNAQDVQHLKDFGCAATAAPAAHLLLGADAHEHTSHTRAGLWSCAFEQITCFCRFKREVTRHYELGKLIGAGSFGSVYGATCRKTGKAFAIKAITKRFQGEFLEYHFVNRVQHEVDIYRHMGNSLNVAHLWDVFEDDTCDPRNACSCC